MYFRYGTLVDGAFGAILLIGALVLQFRTRRYNTWIYWLAVVAVSVTGTMAADGLHIVVGLPYTVTTALYAAILAVIFVAWYMHRGHAVDSQHHDGPARGLLLGHGHGHVRTWHRARRPDRVHAEDRLLLLCRPVPGRDRDPAVAHWKLGMGLGARLLVRLHVTRPLGASVADWLGIQHRYGGLDLGRAAPLRFC